MWKWLALFSICGLIGFAIYLYAHLGIREPVTITTGEVGPLLLIYKEHRGPYHQIAPVITEVEKWAITGNVPCAETFGEYLDDPQSVDEDRLRSNGGCVTEKKPDTLPEGFMFKELSRQKYVIAQFAGSPSIGPYKVYPQVQKYMDEQRLKMPLRTMEIYRVNGQQVLTEYLFEIQ